MCRRPSFVGQKIRYRLLILLRHIHDLVPVLALETSGANSFQQSFAAGELVTLSKITSIATTLGAKTVSAKTFELSQVHPVVPHVVEDSEAVSACHQFLSK